MALFSTIICCVNLTENSGDIVQYTRDLAKLDNSKILVVHSLPSTSNLGNYITSSSIMNEITVGSRKRTEEYLNGFIAKNFSDLNAEPVLLSGNPSQQLLELADKLCADLIVMGSVSQKGVFSFLLSQHSESVIGNTRVPVLVIPNDLNLDCIPPDGF